MNDDSCALASILTWGLLKNQCFFLLVSVTLENKIKIPRFGSALVPACAATFFFFPREMGIRKDRLGCGKQHQDLMFSWSSELPLQSTNTKLTTSRLVYEKCSLHFIPRLLKKKMALLHDSGIPKSSDLKKNGTACESGQPSSAIEFCLEIKAVELRC